MFLETSPGAVFFSPGTGVPYTYHNGMAVFEYPHLAAQPQVLHYLLIHRKTFYLHFMAVHVNLSMLLAI